MKKPFTLDDLRNELAKSNEEKFSSIITLREYLKTERIILINGLLESKYRAEAIGAMGFIDNLVALINQIQEEKDER